MKKLILITLTGLALAASLPVSAAGDKAAGKAKAAVCAACHGADGNSSNPEWPKLAGQGELYLVKQLQDFKSGARQNAIMAGQVAALSDEDMANLSAYFASQTVTTATAKEENLEKGESLFRGGDIASGIAACTGCHGPSGKGNPKAKFPALGGQHAPYIAAQLKAFRSGARANDAGKMMRNVAVRMTDAEIDALSNYISGLH